MHPSYMHKNYYVSHRILQGLHELAYLRGPCTPHQEKFNSGFLWTNLADDVVQGLSAQSQGAHKPLIEPMHAAGCIPPKFI